MNKCQTKLYTVVLASWKSALTLTGIAGTLMEVSKGRVSSNAQFYVDG